MSFDEQFEEILEDAICRCNTCFKRIHEDDPYIVAYKNCYPAYFCKEHMHDAEQYLNWFQEIVEIK